MKKGRKKQIILDKIRKNLSFCDKIIMKILKNYTIKIYRLGLKDEFEWEQQKINNLKK